MQNKNEAPQEWVNLCTSELVEAKRKEASELFEKYGNTVHFPMVLHVDLCKALHTIFACAPNKQEAMRFIQQAIDKVNETK